MAGGVGVSLQAELVCEATSGRAVPAKKSGGKALACDLTFQVLKVRFNINCFKLRGQFINGFVPYADRLRLTSNFNASKSFSKVWPRTGTV